MPEQDKIEQAWPGGKEQPKPEPESSPKKKKKKSAKKMTKAMAEHMNAADSRTQTPKPSAGNATKCIYFSDANDLDRLERMAEVQRISLSSVVQQLVRSFLEQYDKDRVDGEHLVSVEVKCKVKL